MSKQCPNITDLLTHFFHFKYAKDIINHSFTATTSINKVKKVCLPKLRRNIGSLYANLMKN